MVEIILQHLSSIDPPETVKEYVNYRTEEGLTALHYCGKIKPGTAHFKDEDANLISILIDYGGQTELQTYEGNETPMHLAARNGNEAILLAIVNKIGAGMVQIVQNKKSKNGWSPLLEACAQGHVGVSKILLLHHARIDVFDDTGRTALHLSAANGHLELTKLLLQYKAFVNSKSKSGEAPLHSTCQVNFIDF